ncbi:MAG: glycosyltransferase family 2 protein [Sphingobacteriales bacterium]|nr:MAG: glycosyltransferase family 2 protein [Sphingobacteriales bacterium]
MDIKIRVYLLCYNRNDMLPRAVQSLLSQTHQKWVCELHCDKPDNQYPLELFCQINDPRIELHQHETNLGLTGAFNLAFQEVEEKYIAILEEDNWWEPHFMEEMVFAMEQNPDSTVGWANMRIWHFENQNWIDTQKNIWELPDNENRKFEFPHVQQIRSALHSQGCMFVRMHPYNPQLVIPDDLNSGALEAIRERAMGSPILFVNKVLGNYAMLEESHRTKNSTVWSVIELCLISSFFNKVAVEGELLKTVLAKARTGRSKSIHLFLLAKVLNPRSSLHYSDFGLTDYLFFLGYYGKHLSDFVKLVRQYFRLRELRGFLNTHTLKSNYRQIAMILVNPRHFL